MSDWSERIVRIETTTEHIKATLDRLVDNSDTHTMLAQKNAVELVEVKSNILELKSRVQKIEEKDSPSGPMMGTGTKITAFSAGLASVVIALIEYFKR